MTTMSIGRLKRITAMSREIKFRAWDKHPACKGLQYVGSIERWLANPKDFVVMQYTGLKDKNGKEIYEGDIIQTRKGVYWEIIFSRIDGKYIYIREISSFGLTDRQASLIKIVGNIYENPELISSSP